MSTFRKRKQVDRKTFMRRNINISTIARHRQSEKPAVKRKQFLTNDNQSHSIEPGTNVCQYPQEQRKLQQKNNVTCRIYVTILGNTAGTFVQ